MRGEPKRFRSSNKVSRGFCAACGTPLTSEPDGFDVETAIATLDDTRGVAPVIQVGLESRLLWCDALRACCACAAHLLLNSTRAHPDPISASVIESRCPNCEGPREDEELECPKCGVIYAKYRPPRPRSVAPAPAQAQVHNPYAPPASSLVPSAKETTDGVWRSGNLLVMDRDASLPDRCVSCNEPSVQRLVRRLQWHSSWVYILAIFNLLIYALVALSVVERAKIEVPLCERHVRRRRTGIAIAWGIALLGMAVPFAVLGIGPQDDSALPVLSVFTLILSLPIALVLGNAMGRPVIPRKIDHRYIWLRKCSKRLLETLPPAPAGL